MALKTRAPIIPTAIVGAEYIAHYLARPPLSPDSSQRELPL